MNAKNESLPQDKHFKTNSQNKSEKKDFWEANTSKVNSLLKARKLNEALTALQEISTTSSDNCEIFVKLGHLSYKMLNYTDAESWYFKALNTDFNHFESQIWFGLAQTYFQQKYYAKSISAYVHVLTVDPDFEYLSLCYLKIGFCHYYLRDYVQAATYAEKSFVKGDLNDILTADGLCLIGCVQLGYGDLTKAFNYFDKSASLCRTFRTSICLSWKLIQTEPQKSILFLSKLCEISPKVEQIEYRFFKAITFLKLQKLRKSQILLESICKDVSNNYIYSLYLAIVYYKTLNFEKCFAILTQILKIWQYKLDLLLSAYVIAGKANRQIESMEYYMKAYGILCIHGYSVLEITNIFMNAENTGIAEPKFSLLDCPLSKCIGYTSENLSLT